MSGQRRASVRAGGILLRLGGRAVAATVFWSLAVAALSPAISAAQGWVITTDYSTFGRVRGFRTQAPWSVTEDLAYVPGDAVGRSHDGLVYILGRGASNILQIYDPCSGFALVREFSLGNGRNPQDLAFGPDGQAYVSCYDDPVLLRVDVQAGMVTGSFSTAQFADADGLPETGWMAESAGLIYITAQLLDRDNWYAPSGPGAVLIFDPLQEAWIDTDPEVPGVQPIVLAGSDPYTNLEIFTAGQEVRARVGCVGFYGLTDGGIEEVNLTTRRSLGLMVTEAELGGDVTRFSVRGDDLFALVSDAAFVTSVRHWDLETGHLTVMATGNGYVHADLLLDPIGGLFVADRTLGASGLRVFDPASLTEMTSFPLDTGLPPFQFVTPAAGEPQPCPGILPTGPRLGRAFPNPCRAEAELMVSGVAGRIVRILCHDVRGRLVGRAQVTLDAEGKGSYRFLGRDLAGRPLASGIYQVTVQQEGKSDSGLLTLIR